MKNLRVLILDRCDWVCASDIVSISKYYKLEILSVSRCKNLKNSIPYFSLSGHGFRQLKVLDIRLSGNCKRAFKCNICLFTTYLPYMIVRFNYIKNSVFVLALGNTVLQSLYKCPSLLAVYFQNDDKSYALDYNLRRLQVEKGASRRDYWEEEKDEEYFETECTAEDHDSLMYEDTVLTDSGLIVYHNVEHLNNDLKYPNSVLYVEPYSTCTCGYTRKGKMVTKFKEKSINFFDM